ncbi:MAG: MFS transporter [Candidatus Woesearchaeota archaeon]
MHKEFLDHFHIHHLSEITLLYITMAIRSFALSTIGLFIPLILLNMDRSIFEVLLYQSTFPVLAFLIFSVSGNLISRIGIKHTMLISIPFFITHLLLINSIQTYNWPILLLSVSGALASGLFWFAFHTDFAKSTSQKKRGSQVGILHSLMMAISIVGPLVGGVILTLFEAQILIFLNIIFIILSAIPLLLSKDVQVPIHISRRDILYTTTKKQRVSFIAEGIRSYSAVIFWPIFLFILQMSFAVIGSIYTVVRTVNTVTSYFTGKYLDKHNAKKMLKVGTVIDSISLFFRGLIPISALTVTSITSLGGIGFTLLHNSYSKIWYDKAHVQGPKFILSREFYLEIGRSGIAFFGLLLLLVFDIFFALSLIQAITIMCVTIFIFGGISALIMNYID